MKKVFVIAMECEAEAVARNFPDAREEKLFGRKVIRGTLGGEPTAVIVSGIGKVNAAASTLVKTDKTLKNRFSVFSAPRIK